MPQKGKNKYGMLLSPTKSEDGLPILKEMIPQISLYFSKYLNRCNQGFQGTSEILKALLDRGATEV
jgi:hypothetical protein